MNDFYKFASDSPYLTFFLAIIVGNFILGTIKATFTLIGVLVRGQAPVTVNQTKSIV